MLSDATQPPVSLPACLAEVVSNANTLNNAFKKWCPIATDLSQIGPQWRALEDSEYRHELSDTQADHAPAGLNATATLAEVLAGNSSDVSAQCKAIEHEYNRAAQSLARGMKTLHSSRKKLKFDDKAMQDIISFLYVSSTPHQDQR